MGGGYEVDPESLAQSSKGINGDIEELRDHGVVGTGDVGRGFSQLGLSGMDVGHAGLKGAFDEFCTRWSWGVRTLVQDGNEIAVRVGLNAGKYALMEQYGKDLMKQLYVDAAGNPHMTDDQATQTSWSDLMAQSTSVDYSTKSFDDATDRMGDSWKDTWEDTKESRSDPLGTTMDDLDTAFNGDDSGAGGK